MLLTGSTGYVGSNLLARWSAALPAIRFVALTRSLRKAEALGIPHVRFVKGDIMWPDSVSAALDGVEAVVHLAALKGPRAKAHVVGTNVDGTQHVIARAAAAGVRRIVYVSSHDVNHVPLTVYADSKRRAEEIVTSSGLAHVILRPTVIYGGHGKTPFTALEWAVKHLPCVPVIDDGAHKLQPLHVDDLTGVIVQALHTARRSGTYEIGGPEEFSQVALVRAMHQFLRKRWPTVAVPVPVSLLSLVLGPLSASERVRALADRLRVLSQDKLANNEILLRDYDLAFTRLADGLARTGRRACAPASPNAR